MRPQTKIRKVEKLIEALEKEAIKTASVIANSLIDHLADNLIIKNRKIVNAEANYATANKVKRVVTKKDYTNYFKRFTGALSDIEMNTLAVFKTEFETSGSSVTKSKIGKAKATKTRAAFKDIDYTYGTAEVRRVINRAIANGSTLAALRSSVRELVETKIAKDLTSIAQKELPKFDREATVEINQEIDAGGFYRYEGPPIELSRKFCLLRKGKIFHISEIRKFGSAQDEFGGYTDKSAGLFDGKPKTSYDPVSDLGGHGCIDFLVPVSRAKAKNARTDLFAAQPELFKLAA